MSHEGMTLELIERAASGVEDLDTLARSVGLPTTDFTDAFARAVAERFVRGEISWTVGDAAMNWLFAYAIHLNDLDVLSPAARRVFEAFDEGEYPHVGEPEDRQGESRTRALLGWALSGDERLLAAFQPEVVLPLVRASAVSIAKRAIAGEITAIVAARELLFLRRRVDVSGDDPDFATVAAIEARTAHLPLGDVRRLWAPHALAEKDVEIAALEKWAQEVGRPALIGIVQRFDSAR